MSAFVDTSAFIALLVAEDENHARAARTWSSLIESNESLVTSNYIVVETCALLQRRIGMTALKKFLEDVLPIVLIEWVDMPMHDAGINGLMLSGRNGPNIVDCISFAIMRKLAITQAFTLDGHFSAVGFTVL
jgi:predicted nucleic acid-binding protein